MRGLAERMAAYLIAPVLVAVAAAAATLLQRGLGLADPALLFLTAVLLTAVVGGLRASILAAFLSLLVYDFFFVDPLYTLSVTKPQDVLSLTVFLIVAVLTSSLMTRVRDQREVATRREARTATLYAFTRDLAIAVGIDDLLPIVARHLSEQAQAPVVVSVLEGERLTAGSAHPLGTVLPPTEHAVAVAAWVEGETAGEAAAGATADRDWRHAPLRTVRGTVAVLSLKIPRGRAHLTPDQQQLVDALASQAAVAIERCRINAVLEEKAKTEQVIEASEDGIIVLDASSRVAHVNEVACAILGIPRDALIGRSFDAVASGQSQYLRVRETVRELVDHPQREPERLEITLFLRGRDHHYVLRPTRFRARAGAPPGLILVLQDFTYLREQEVRRENLVATLSHELRTPLTSLRMATELLRQRATGLTSDCGELLDTAYEDVLRLQEVAQHFVDLARTRATAIGLDRRTFEVHELMARVVRMCALQAKEKDVSLEMSQERVPPLSGDETKLSWALSNLIANAIRYTPAGGQVRVEASVRDHSVRLSVSDTGPGIAADQQSRIFERYAQDSAIGEPGAAGLGLAIVRDIVQAHGGRVHLESAPGEGTQFTLELPLE